ncbi:DUF2934 domain-containing protein [Singulisphaera sp. PoT]|uniref:DUF2934 domain-containing protein n=1 Tax=Singulisphaera sp. PoT TaxID=3411797 RepID=UPI003BF5D620
MRTAALAEASATSAPNRLDVAIVPGLEERPTSPHEKPTESGDAEQDEIALLAFTIWHERGRPEGSDKQDWTEAERRLGEQRSGRPTISREMAAEKSRESAEMQHALAESPSIRDRMISIGRGNQQAGRQGS